ncbi:MAG: CoA transferase [Candidatus Dormibacteraeota bacterium]|nr:CoA transferase [Candidatus Dormibacteraeota bacterium]
MSGGSPGQLAGLRVLELGSLIAGPFCTRQLADMGARVLKIEPPGTGDPLRNWSVLSEEGSLWSFVQSRNKESIAIDLRSPIGQELVRRLAERVDVVVENFRAGRLESWGLGPDVLRKANPRLVLVRISGFGQDGPYRDRPGYGSTGESMGGLRYVTGFPDRPPLKMGVSIGDAIAALYATIGTLAALRRRDATGRGEVVDVALYEAVFSLLEGTLPEYGYSGVVRERMGNALPGAAPSNSYPTADGRFITIGANGESIFVRFAAAIGMPYLTSDPRFENNQARRANSEALDAIITGWTIQHSVEKIWELLNRAEVPASPVYSIADIVQDPQFRAREMIVETDGPKSVGQILMPGFVPRYLEAPSRLRWHGPRVGEHTAAVLGSELGLSDEEVNRLSASGVIGLDRAAAPAP